MESLSHIINYFMIAITIIVVAVPEGLPLAVTISLAYSVSKMKDENNLVRQLQSCEIMGGANNICSDKTGTLTQNKMEVSQLYFLNGNYSTNDFNIDFINSDNNFNVNLLCQSIAVNSEADPIFDQENDKFIQLGNVTECALIELAWKLGINYKEIRKTEKIAKIIPFSSNRKKMTTIIKRKSDGKFVCFTKGASELILEKCNKIAVENSTIEDISIKKDYIINEIINNYSKLALRTISIAYKVLEITEEKQLNELKNEEIESNMTLLAIAGIEDPIREDVPTAIIKCKKAGITVRMVTGDNLMTAKAIAMKSGILDKLSIEINQNQQAENYQIMEGKKFRELINNSGDGITIDNKEEFLKIEKELRVLARSSPEDKYLLVSGLIELNNVVAVTGDGTNDAPALKKADVGFAMGISGTEVAKDASDIILLDDKFSSIVIACKWGRNVYDSIRKFLQFQLTVNVSALFIAFVGSIFFDKSPLNAIQMLWVNLIMDTFASLALATDSPSEELLDRQPYSRKDYIINGSMWRNIFGQTFYQIFVLCIVLFLGPKIFGIQETVSQSKYDEKNLVHFTIVFQTFVFLQIFNEINCRKIDNRFNVFQGFFKNYLFLFILILTIVVQIFIVQFGGKFAQTSPLTLNQNLICILIGAFSLVVGFSIKFIPGKIFGKIKIFEEKSYEPNEIDEGIASKIRRRGSSRIMYKKSGDYSIEKKKSIS